MLIWIYYDVTLVHDYEYVLVWLWYELVYANGMCMKAFKVTWHPYKKNVPLCIISKVLLAYVSILSTCGLYYPYSLFLQ